MAIVGGDLSIQQGEQITANLLTAMIERLVASILGGEGIIVEKAAGGQIVISQSGRQPTGQEIALQRFRVKSEADNHLVCRTWNPAGNPDAETPGVEGTVDVLVAKPWKHRRAPFDGLTRLYTDGQSISYAYSAASTRVATDVADATITETQVLTDAYSVDEEILAIRGMGGGTGVTDAVWEVLNDGRFWTRSNPQP